MKSMPALLLLLLVSFLSACSSLTAQQDWVETTAKITEAEELEDGVIGYSVTYHSEQSTAVNTDGEAINGEMTVHQFGAEKLPVEGQTIKIRYLRDEPVIYEILSDIQFAE